MNRIIGALLAVAALSLSGCAGGSMGTGVRQYSHAESFPEEEWSIFNIAERTVTCTLDRGRDTLRISLGPVKLASAPRIRSTTVCTAKFLPLSRTLRALVALNGKALTEAPFELQMRDKRPGARWRVFYGSETSRVSGKADFALASIPNISLSAGHEYRIRIALPEGYGEDAVFVFELE